MCETMFFFSVQLCVNPWTVLRQADLQMYLFLGGKGMFLCFYVKKIVPVDMAWPKPLGRGIGLLAGMMNVVASGGAP